MFLVMLPTYNEKENLEQVVRKIIAIDPRPQILIIDDSSPDGTGEIADRLASEFDRVSVKHRPPKSGRGSASLDGYKYAIENGYDYYLEMDVDLSHSPDELPRLLEKAPSADLVIGSRFVEGGGVDGWDWKRRLLHSMADLAVKVILGTPNTDHTNGYRCYSTKTLKRINFDKLNATGYVAHTILENVYYRAGFKIEEVPTFFKNRTHGTSKMGKNEMVGGLVSMLKFRWRLIRGGVGQFLFQP